MKRLAFKPECGYVMVQYRNDQQFQQYRLSAHDVSDRDSKDEFSRYLFEILLSLEVDKENISLVGQTIGELTKYPNQIWYKGKSGEILTALVNRFPAEDAHTDEATMARMGIYKLDVVCEFV